MERKKLTYTFEEAKKRLEKYCAYQDRCHWEVERKLVEMRMIPEAKELILLHLMQHNFLNEERFAKSFARGKFRIKKWGRIRITNELKRREISAYNIREALKEIDEKEYHQTLEDLAEKKYRSIANGTDYQKKQKTFQYLLRKGFESGLISEVLENLTEDQ